MIQHHINHFSQYNFLWKDDLKEVFNEFMKYEPSIINIENEVPTKLLTHLNLLHTTILCVQTKTVVHCGMLTLSSQQIASSAYCHSTAFTQVVYISPSGGASTESGETDPEDPD